MRGSGCIRMDGWCGHRPKNGRTTHWQRGFQVRVKVLNQITTVVSICIVRERRARPVFHWRDGWRFYFRIRSILHYKDNSKYPVSEHRHKMRLQMILGVTYNWLMLSLGLNPLITFPVPEGKEMRQIFRGFSSSYHIHTSMHASCHFLILWDASQQGGKEHQQYLLRKQRLQSKFEPPLDIGIVEDQDPTCLGGYVLRRFWSSQDVARIWRNGPRENMTGSSRASRKVHCDTDVTVADNVAQAPVDLPIVQKTSIDVLAGIAIEPSRVPRFR